MRLIALALAWSVGIGAAMAQTVPNEEGPPFAGLFYAVDARAMSDLPSDPLAFDEPPPVRLTGELVWWDGTACEAWTAQALPPLDVVLTDPAIADLLMPPVGEPGMFTDHRIGETFAISCAEGGVVATVVQIDDRVLVDVRPDLGRYVVIERELLYEDVVALQRTLTAAGFEPGPVDGSMGPRTRGAVAVYAQWRLSLDSHPGRGVVTSNLIDGMSFSALD
jgi:hypothetical protein